MGIYSVEINRKGYTEEVFYHCSPDCMERRVKSLTDESVEDGFDAGSWEKDGITVSWGRVFSIETDYDVWDTVCGEFMWHGLECECEDPTTERDPLREDQLDKV